MHYTRKNTIQEIGEEINMCYLNKLTVDFRNLHNICHESWNER